MSLDRSIFIDQPLAVVANSMADCEPGSQMDQIARAEFLFRQTNAQLGAARATEDTARATSRYTRYMLWSVIVLVISALGTLGVSIASLMRG